MMIYLRNILTLLFLLIIQGLIVQAYPLKFVNEQKEKMLLTEAISLISQQYNVFFTFDHALVKDITVEYESRDHESVEEAISGVLNGTNLKFKLYDRRFVILYQNDDKGLESLKEMVKHFENIIADGVEKKSARNNLEPLNAIPLRDAWIAPIRKLEKPVLDVSGVVSDQAGEPLIGVNVQVKNSNKGSATDIDGRYVLKDVNENAVLVFSYIGYLTQEVPVDGRHTVDVTMLSDAQLLDEVVVVGYGTQKKSDLTGAVSSINAESFKFNSITQFTELLAGTIAGFNSNQGTSAQGGATMEIRGATSISGGTTPLIVLDGVIFNGSLRDINPNDIESINVMKDASSAAVFGAKAASGVVFVTTRTGHEGKPSINFSTRFGLSENYNERRGLGPEEYIKFRQDAMRTFYPESDINYYVHPDELPTGISKEEWLNLNDKPLGDYTKEWISRMRFFPVEEMNYLNGTTMDMYDEVFRRGLRQSYDLSISGGTQKSTYYWSIGYNNNEGILVGDQFSSVRSRLSADYEISSWLNVGLNVQFSDRDESSVPASLNFYRNSPFGQMFDENGNLRNMPHGHSVNPLLAYYRTDLTNTTNNIFSNLYSNITLPWGLEFKVSYQPFYSSYKKFSFINVSPKLGGLPTETASGTRSRSNTFNWMIDNILTWNKSIGVHNIDLTFLSNIEENKFWSDEMSNRNFNPNQELSYSGLNFGDSPEIYVYDSRSTGSALMARINYLLNNRYLLTASVRQDGYSAFGIENPRAIFPAIALGWVLSEEKFFKIDEVEWLKIRASWGVNGNRDIGIYSALARTNSSLWYDGNSNRVGIHNSTLANNSLRWERTSALNIGMDLKLFDNRISLTTDVYNMSTKDLLLNRELPRITGFNNITSNLGELQNIGIEVTLETWNYRLGKFSWRSSLVYSQNRNEIVHLWGDYGNYTLLGEERYGEIPDLTNKWFPGYPLDVIWDYNVTGIWQLDEADQAARYNLEPGDFKVEDVDDDGIYYELVDKQFIGYTEPRHRLGLRNDFELFDNFTASIFIRSDLGHKSSYAPALNGGWGESDRFNRNVGPVPYWTKENPNNEYSRLNPFFAPFGGGLMIYKPRSFIRIQDISFSYRLPQHISEMILLGDLQIFTSIRNLYTYTKWPGWDPESGMSPMPRNYTFGINIYL